MDEFHLQSVQSGFFTFFTFLVLPYYSLDMVCKIDENLFLLTYASVKNHALSEMNVYMLDVFEQCLLSYLSCYISGILKPLYCHHI